MLARLPDFQTCIIAPSSRVRTFTFGSERCADVYGHVQWILKKRIVCRTVCVPASTDEGALEAIDRLVAGGVQIPSVTHAVGMPTAKQLRLLPNCTSFSASCHTDKELTQLLDFCVKNIQQLQLFWRVL